ncbi:MAG: TonB-dependent receptor [Bacteroidetes bacterium]|nr:TonB-dependent receptor [Bacteroidota bacterium]
MKRFWLMVLLGAFFLSAAHSQSPLEERISLNIKDLPLRDALYLLIDQGIKLSFNNNILPKEKIVTIQVEAERVGDVLPMMFSGTDLGFELVGAQIVLVKKAPPPSKQYFTLSGFLQDSETGERIIGAAVFEEKRRVGTYTNEFGFFNITMAEGPARLFFSNLGYEPDTLEMQLNSNQILEIELGHILLAEVIVNSFSDSTLLQTELSTLNLNLQQAKKMVSLGGETDVMRLAYTLPGIQTGADGFGGISVRGGNVDQNLFLLDGVPVYNATHGIGIYSIYNTSAVRSAKVLKGSFPAQYGGRISSIWDIQTKEGNSKKLQGEAEFGPSSLQLTLEGPFAKEKGSYIVSGRRALFDFFSVPITRRIRERKGAEGFLKYFFFDLNAKVNYAISPKDRIYLSFYTGKDDFQDVYSQYRWFQDTLSVVRDEETVVWGNNVAALRWNHLLSDKIFANVTATFSQYFYKSEDFVDLDLLSNDHRISRDVLLLKYSSNVQDFALKTDFDYAAFGNHRLRFGASATRHEFQPGVITFEEATIIDSVRTKDTLGAYLKNPLISHEFDAYVQDEVQIGHFLQANIGLRASALRVDGYNFFAAQPRLLLRFFEGEKFSFDLSVCRVTQFLHLLSPTNIGLPKDLWVSATEQAPPQRSWQFVAGARQQLKSWLSLEMEGYYKKLENLVYFEGGGLETINATNWQREISVGKGWSYGAELLLKVERQKVGGWLGYTYAHADRQFGKEVNNGNKFPLRLDRRHNFSLQFLYRIGHRWDCSAGFVYATGTAFTFPTQQYELVQPPGSAPTEIKTGTKVIDELNGYRLPDYHRLDLAVNHYFTVRNVRHSLKFGVYNAYFRKNPVYYTLRDDFDEDGTLNRKVIRVSLLPVFPTLRYMLEFR